MEGDDDSPSEETRRIKAWIVEFHRGDNKAEILKQILEYFARRPRAILVRKFRRSVLNVCARHVHLSWVVRLRDQIFCRSEIANFSSIHEEKNTFVGHGNGASDDDAVDTPSEATEAMFERVNEAERSTEESKQEAHRRHGSKPA